ncbi:MAG: hypothetical protein R6V59_09225 [Dehalococcoidia bacterium]
MSAKLKQGKVIAGIAAAAILVVVVLVLTVVPGNDVAATVNGEEIMQEDVAEMQELYAAQGMPISEEQALEQLIRQEVLYQAAAEYLPTEEEAEEQLEAQVAMMGMTMEEFHEALEAEGLCYDEQMEDFRRYLAIENYLDEAVEVPEVTEEEAREFYEEYKQQYPEEELPPFEEAEPQIVMQLEQQKQQEAMGPFIEELREKADIEEYM